MVTGLTHGKRDTGNKAKDVCRKSSAPLESVKNMTCYSLSWEKIMNAAWKGTEQKF
jgi:hypothetical protein